MYKNLPPAFNLSIFFRILQEEKLQFLQMAVPPHFPHKNMRENQVVIKILIPKIMKEQPKIFSAITIIPRKRLVLQFVVLLSENWNPNLNPISNQNLYPN